MQILEKLRIDSLEKFHNKTYEWNTTKGSYGLNITVNEEKKIKMYLKFMSDNFEFNEFETANWYSYSDIDRVDRDFICSCTKNIANEIAHWLATLFKPDEYILIKNYSNDCVLWLKLCYNDKINVSLFYPDISPQFVVRESGFKETYNSYEDQWYRLYELSNSVDKKERNLYSWVIEESVRYFRNIIIKELSVLKLPNVLFPIISDYIIQIPITPLTSLTPLSSKIE